MVARLTLGKKKYADVEADMLTVIASAEELRGKLLAAVDDDIRAYSAVMDAYKRDKADPSRDAAIQEAMRGAADVPLKVMRYALSAMQLARIPAEKGNVNAASDAAVSVHMAMAAIEGAALNVRINANSFTDADAARQLRDTVTALLEEARPLCAEIIRTAETRAGLNT